MFPSESSSQRFNLLLLSEGEHSFNDYAVTYYPSLPSDLDSVQYSVQGRLKVCSQSVFFDPLDISLPIIKYPFQHVSEIKALPSNGLISSVNNGEAFYIKASQIVKLKEDNLVKPYVFVKEDVVHRFGIKHASINVVLPLISSLMSIFASPNSDDRIRAKVVERERNFAFDMTWLESFGETIVIETYANKITPLVSNGGRLLITNKVIYFQPFNNVEAKAVEKIPLKDCVSIIKRRRELRPIGLELFCGAVSSHFKHDTSFSESHTSSYFFSFRDSSTRDLVYEKLISIAPLEKLEMGHSAEITFKWRCGQMSNFDYLMYLNSLAHRSFNDLTQYPVVPWVIADYTSQKLDLTSPKTFRDLSKPIGSLNADRLAAFKRRYNDTPDDQPKFLYGTHYSNPAYVLFYLVRIAPEYMLRLQNGKFDEAERLFNSIEETWENVLTNPADLKELIPEFYSEELSCNGEFLCNHGFINFGHRADGSPVGDVKLPAWASSASDFIRKNREALESEYVSEHLHEWIDLIFGYKQRGKQALEANNLFHPLTYEGAVDIEKETDPIRRMAILVQINEFGQTPAQIFSIPHQKRFTQLERQSIANGSHMLNIHQSPIGALTSQFPLKSIPNEQEYTTQQKDRPTDNPFGPSTTDNPYGTSQTRLSNSQSSSFSSLNSSQSSLLTIPGPIYTNQNENLSSWNPQQRSATPLQSSNLSLNSSMPSLSSFSNDNSLPFNSSLSDIPEYGKGIKPSDLHELHLSDVPSSTDSHKMGQFSKPISSQMVKPSFENGNALNISESLIPSKPNKSVTLSSGVIDSTWADICELSPTSTLKIHRQAVMGLALSEDQQTMYSVSQDSTLKIYSLTEEKLLRSNNISQLALSCCALTSDQKYVVIGSWDNHLYLYSNDFGRVSSNIQAHDDSVSCISLYKDRLLSGSWDTTVRYWFVRPTGLGESSMIESFFDCEVSSIKWGSDGNVAVCGSDDGMIALYDIRANSLIRSWAAHDDAVTDLQLTSDGRVISCSKSGCLKVQSDSGNDIFSVGIPSPLRCLSSNGAALITGDEGALIRFWDVIKCEEIGKIPSNTTGSPVSCILPSAGCRFLLSGCNDGSIIKWTRQ